jgi:hypothetical protein
MGVFTINPGPSRKDQHRTVNLQVTNRCGERSEIQQFDQSTISKFNIVLQPGDNQFVFTVLNKADVLKLPNGDTRICLVKVRKLFIKPS